MALIDKASLLMVPSTYEAGKLYNVLPSGNRAPDSTDQNSGYDQTRADFDFDRGSNTAATRIGSDGLIKKYRENLLTESNNFSDSDWTKSGVSVTSGQSGYDETTNAYKIQVLTSGAPRKIAHNQTTANGVLTMSIYAKAGTAPIIAVEAAGSNGFYKYFNLSTGTGGSQGGSIVDSSMVDVGSGWYRLSITGNPTTVTSPQFFVCDVDNSTTAATGSNILIQNAQLESGLVATDYLESTSVTGKAGVLVDLPRINYDANGENGALLLEPSRQQLLQYSEYISGWTAAGLTITENQTTSPEGVSNAAKLTLPSGSAIKRIALGSMPTTAVARSYSFFVKSDDIAAIQLVHSGDLQGYANFDISSGVVGTKGTKTTSDIESYGNGWYRCIANFDATNAFGSTIYIYVKDNASGGYGGSTSEQGDLFVWGGQYEAGSYATSYIPNHSGTGGVTRAADSCSVTGASDVIGGTSGTIFFDVVMNESLTNTNYKQFFYYTDSGANQTYMFVAATNYVVGNARLGNIISSTQLQAGERYKIAVTYATNSFKMYINGSQDATSSSGTPIDNENILSIGSYSGSSEFNEFVFKQYAHFQEALSDSELATLTTL